MRKLGVVLILSVLCHLVSGTIFANLAYKDPACALNSTVAQVRIVGNGSCYFPAGSFLSQMVVDTGGGAFSFHGNCSDARCSVCAPPISMLYDTCFKNGPGYWSSISLVNTTRYLQGEFHFGANCTSGGIAANFPNTSATTAASAAFGYCLANAPGVYALLAPLTPSSAIVSALCSNRDCSVCSEIGLTYADSCAAISNGSSLLVVDAGLVPPPPPDTRICAANENAPVRANASIQLCQGQFPFWKVGSYSTLCACHNINQLDGSFRIEEIDKHNLTVTYFSATKCGAGDVCATITIPTDGKAHTFPAAGDCDPLHVAVIRGSGLCKGPLIAVIVGSTLGGIFVVGGLVVLAIIVIQKIFGAKSSSLATSA